jgi:hypothetical protein
MNKLRIDLSTTYDDLPSHCKVTSCGKTLFDGAVTEGTTIETSIDSLETFGVEIEKTGKSKAMVDNSRRQIVEIERIQLNGIDLKILECGRFLAKQNTYLKDHEIQTVQLNMNGTWRIKLPKRRLKGSVRGPIQDLILRDHFADCDVACFGCSQTYGLALEPHETWPSQLQKLTNLSVRNYGMTASSINEITVFVEQFLESHNADKIILYLPHTFRRQLVINGQLEIIFPGKMPENKDLLYHGEEHSVAVLAGELENWLDGISKTREIYFGTYQEDEHHLFEKTPASRYLLPFLSSEGYPKASDGQHFGAKFTQDLANHFADYLKIGKKSSISSDFLGG